MQNFLFFLRLAVSGKPSAHSDPIPKNALQLREMILYLSVYFKNQEAVKMNIISGFARGHKIFAPNNIRPTRGKVREALFSMIAVQDKTFLDLFAGSGAVGVEALSRGAAKVVFVERSRKAANYIKRNLEKTKLEGEIINKSVSAALDNLESAFDFIFMDPPYKTELIKKTLKKIDAVLKDNSIIIVERPSTEEFEYNGFKIFKSKIYGDTSLAFLRR